MEHHVKILKDKILARYKNANDSQKELLEELYPEIFKGKVTDRIKTFDDVLKELGIDKHDFEDNCEGLSPDEVAYRQLKLIVRVFNEGWKPDFTDHDQWKYYPWFEVNAAGSAYAYAYAAPSNTGAYLGSPLCFKSRELATYAGRQFEDIYNDYLL